MEWSPEFAYAIGLIVSDGSLSKDGRHIDLTSKDLDQIKTFINILGLKNKIGVKSGSMSKSNIYFRVQFGNVNLYKFLLKIGITPNKSKSINELEIPQTYFPDFLRGYFDGDGSTYSYFDSRWKNSFLLYLSFSSGSLPYLEWLQGKIKMYYGITGRVGGREKDGYQLRYAKRSSLALIKIMYYEDTIPCLQRKRSKITHCLGIIQSQAEVEKLVYSLP